MIARRHTPVLAREVVSALRIQPDGMYIDATFGRGGHSTEILAALKPQGRLVVIDRDPEAVRWAESLAKKDPRITVFRRPFSDLEAIADLLSIRGHVNGIVFDLGVSSPQLDDERRGFSFTDDGPLDMRMDPEHGVPASQWLATVSGDELEQVLRYLGEERYAKRIARAVIETRRSHPIERTRQLVEIIEQAMPKREPNKHPATRTFQAIRMFVNHELDQLRAALPQAVELLTASGRLVVISFHSLEDRIVKRFFRNEAKGDPFPPDVPVPAYQLAPRLKIIGKPIRASQAEVDHNPRSRSAIMRVAERMEMASA